MLLRSSSLHFFETPMMKKPGHWSAVLVLIVPEKHYLIPPPNETWRGIMCCLHFSGIAAWLCCVLLFLGMAMSSLLSSIVYSVSLWQHNLLWDPPGNEWHSLARTRSVEFLDSCGSLSYNEWLQAAKPGFGRHWFQKCACERGQKCSGDWRL